jgi:hypothetical protein
MLYEFIYRLGFKSSHYAHTAQDAAKLPVIDASIFIFKLGAKSGKSY